ncbi:hypothetical protein ACHAWX_005702 [Stephanocyclus meneghinianus]
MNITGTLKSTLSALAVLLVVHAFFIFKFHVASSVRNVFIDHRHQAGHRARETLSQGFVPVVIRSEHLSSNSLYLPEALRFPLYTNPGQASQFNPKGSCCEMAALKGKAPTPKNIQCEGICHTERACKDPLYPFETQADATFFREKTWNATNLPQLRKKCTEKNRLLNPPFQWCRQWMVADYANHSENVETLKREIDWSRLAQHNHKNINPLQADLPPPGCSRTSEGGGSGPFQHLTLFPSAKLAFCGIPKVSITQWLQFLRFTFGAKDYQAFPHAKPDIKLMRFDRLEEKSQMKILNDPEWKFAVFLRNPAERLLSAYLDKVNGKSLRDRDHFKFIYNMTHTPTFDQFVKAIAKNRTDFELGSKTREKLWGVDWLTDPHWRPQSYSCGLSEFLPRFSFVGSLDRIEEQARALLQEVGLWDNYGKYYHRIINTDGITSGICSLPPPVLRVEDELFGFLQLPRETNGTEESGSYRHSHHSTGSQSKLDEYYTPELRSIVEEELYQMDVKLWKLIENEENLVSGSELALKISSGRCKARALILLREAH